MRSKHVGPLHVRATLWRENDKEVEITCYNHGESARKMGAEGLFWEESLRARTFRRPLERDGGSPRTSLQGKEGVLRPLGLLVGAGGGSSRVSGVSSGGRRQRV